MLSEMMLIRGSFVLSLSGRDKGRIMIVTDSFTDAAGNSFAMLADGMLRKVEKPKIKKLKHLRLLALPPVDCGALTNKTAAKAVKEALAAYQET